MTSTPAPHLGIHPPPRWWSLTTSGSVTVLIGATCLVALGSQALVRGHSAASNSVVFATLVIVALVALDRYVERRYGERLPRRLAVGVVVVHALLVEGLTLLDGLTYTAMMYLTLPFPAFFLLGRRAGMAISAGVLIWFTLKYSLLKPGWFVDGQALTTFLLFVVALILITAMAQLVQRERAIRWHTEALLHTLDQAHQQLAASHTELLRASAQTAEMATIAERNRLARDIHDSLGHYLTVVGVQLEKALLVADEDPPALHAALGHAKRLTDQALRDVRASVGTLRQDEAPFELVRALHQLVADLRGLPFVIECSISGDEERFSPQQRIALFRAAQEGLTNVQRHANAQQVRLRLGLGEHAATLTLDDDGRGIADDWGIGPGLGLRGVQERLELVSGRLLVTRNPTGGTRLAVTVPRTSVSGGRSNG